MRRFFIERPDQRPLRPGQRLVLDAEESKHILTVLRAETGAVLALTDGGGCAIEAELIGTHKRSCEVRVTTVTPVTEEVAPPLLHLACAVVKGRRFEFALEKAVELGVHAITPLACERGVVNPRDGKLDRWRHLLIAALKQSERCHLPVLHELTSPAALLDDAAGAVLFGAAPVDLAPADQVPMTAVDLVPEGDARAEPPSELLLLIGPEGGWTAAELQLFRLRGARPLDLGPHVLRTETAAVAGLAVLQRWRHRWRSRPRA